MLLVAARTKGRCKWNSYNSNVFVEGFCSSWSRHYVCIKSGLSHSCYSHNVISVLSEESFANLNYYSSFSGCIIPHKHESMLYFFFFEDTLTDLNNTSILKKRLILLKYLWLQILMGTEAPACRVLSRYTSYICGSSENHIDCNATILM
jgi:hypothetical protein